MALTHPPESRLEASGTGLLDHPGMTAEAARHRVPRQARVGAPALGVTAMAAALGATGLTAGAAAAATPNPAPAAPIAAPDGTPAATDGAADPGLALAARIQQQADSRTATEEAARLEAANEAAAKRAAQQAVQVRQAPAAADAEAAAPRAEPSAEAPALAVPQPADVQLPLTKYTLSALGQAGGHWAQLHTGLDFAAPAGTPVTAVAGGQVSSAGWSGAYGYRVIQTLPDGTELWYCHLATIAVPAGPLAQGAVLGTVGATGTMAAPPGAGPAGPRLRLEVRPGGGAPVEAAGWLHAHGVTP
ncbi:M23 family metallopeptidase [Kitasatospora sp. NBC_01287]|uniref:M23 family metallopeptidase n=1 Tax=Kitasatospora sp. NBC_01287 TaxID=2903573 RepID=UPI002255C70A|nr:M23 family metallopeptidase [Kitasatospora sp. NBC_01287]MCX4747456.1 M23 family metallopeptidase [Kitasatospora sp. NBC_01287]